MFNPNKTEQKGVVFPQLSFINLETFMLNELLIYAQMVCIRDTQSQMECTPGLSVPLQYTAMVLPPAHTTVGLEYFCSTSVHSRILDYYKYSYQSPGEHFLLSLCNIQ